MNKLVALGAESIEKNKRDFIVLISGDRGNRKTATLLRICKQMAKEQGKTFSMKRDIYYTEVGDLAYRVLTEKNLIVGIDEGYFAAKNTKILVKKVSDLLDNLTAGRNRGHTIVINFVKFSRAAKTLLEICNYWIHKPTEPWGILYIRDREFVGDDAWSVEDILKAKGVFKKRWLMKHNPHYITTLRVFPLSDKIFDEYNKYKEEHQAMYAKSKKLRLQMDEQLETISASLFDDFKKGEIVIDQNNWTATDRQLKIYLQRKYDIPSPKAKIYLDKLKERIIQERAYQRVMLEKEASNSDEAEL